mgnify:CR=1 FL=1
MMTTATKLNGQADEKITALYCRLSVDDDNKDEESNSITNQKQILQDYARKEGYTNTMFFVDDGVSGTTFQRPNFMRMERMAENGKIGTIIVKDLSRFGREQVEMGRLTQVVYPSLGIRFIAIQERVDILTGDGVEMNRFYLEQLSTHPDLMNAEVLAVLQPEATRCKCAVEVRRFSLRAPPAA